MTSTHRKCSFWLLAGAFLFFALTTPRSNTIAALFVIEPDDYADGQFLNNVSALVTLSTAVPPSGAPTFDVVAYTDPDGNASTGTKVFAHGSGIGFWNTNRKFRMDFSASVSSISLDYIGSGFFGNSYIGRIEAYSAGGALLASDETSPLFGGQHETMNVSAPNIAYAFAYPPADPFGDLDHLQFSAVPEPSTLVLATTATLITLRRRRL